jgi:hypothetical protein
MGGMSRNGYNFSDGPGYGTPSEPLQILGPTCLGPRGIFYPVVVPSPLWERRQQGISQLGRCRTDNIWE